MIGGFSSVLMTIDKLILYLEPSLENSHHNSPEDTEDTGLLLLEKYVQRYLKKYVGYERSSIGYLLYGGM